MQRIFQAEGYIQILVPNEPHTTYWYNAVSQTFWMDDCLQNKDMPIRQVTDSVKLVELERFKTRHLREKGLCAIA